MNLLITGAWKNAKKFIEKIELKGHEVVFMQYEKDKLPCSYEWVEGVIGNGLFLTHDIKKFINLKYIQLTSAGYDRVPMEYIKEHSITIYNAKGVYSIPMAEFAVAGVLQIYKQMQIFADNQKQHIWEKQRNLLELYGKKVCIVGCGSVGTECAKRFQAFGCEVFGIDPFVYENEYFDLIFRLDKLEEILKESDIIVLTLPLTKDTEYLMDEDKLQRMKEGSILVNIARGEILQTEALIKVLPKLKGAVLDVFEKEPISRDSVIWNMENVVITPHNSFVSDKNNTRLDRVILSNLIRRQHEEKRFFENVK